MRPKPRIHEFAKQHQQHIATSRHAVTQSTKMIEFSRERLASAQKAISNSAARERRHRERHEKQAA